MLDKAIRAVLISRPVMAVKRTLKNMYWSVAGRRIVNPPLPVRPKTLLFICYGNICRSAFAEYIWRRLLQEGNIQDGKSDSAGLRARNGTGSPDRAVDAARDWEIDLTSHRSKKVTADMVEQNEMLLVMEVWQLEALRKKYPARHDRFFLLPLLAADPGGGGSGYARYNLADPYGTDLASFRTCFSILERSLLRLFERVYGAVD